MQVEDIPRIGLTSRRTAEYQRDLAVGHGLLREVIVHHQGMPSGIPEILADSGSGKRGEILYRSGIRSSGGHHYRIVHGSVSVQRLHEIGYRRGLLTHSHIDTVHRISGLVIGPLVDNRIDCYRGLAGLTVSDDKFPLSATDRDHGIYGLDAGLKRLVDRLTEYDSRSLAVQRHLHPFPGYLSGSVYRLTERIDHSSQKSFSDIYGRGTACPADHVAFLDMVRGTEQHGSDIVLLKVHHHGLHAAVKLEQFAGLGVAQSEDTHHAVTYLKYRTDLCILGLQVYSLKLGQQRSGDFRRFYLICILTHILILIIFKSS